MVVCWVLFLVSGLSNGQDCDLYYASVDGVSDCIACSPGFHGCFACEIVEYDLIVNGSFEEPQVAISTTEVPEVPPWIVEGGKIYLLFRDETLFGRQYFDPDTDYTNLYTYQLIRTLPGYFYTFSLYVYPEADWSLGYQNSLSMTVNHDDVLTISDSYLEEGKWLPFSYTIYGKVQSVGFRMGGPADGRQYGVDLVSVKPSNSSIKYEAKFTYRPSSECTICSTGKCADCNCDNPQTSTPVLKCYGGIEGNAFQPTLCSPLPN